MSVDIVDSMIICVMFVTTLAQLFKPSVKLPNMKTIIVLFHCFSRSNRMMSLATELMREQFLPLQMQPVKATFSHLEMTMSAHLQSAY